MRLETFFFGVFLLAIPCMANSETALFLSDFGVEKYKAMMLASPEVTKLVAGETMQCRPDEVEVHFKKFNLLTSPDLIYNWQYHYVVGNPSKPAWKFKALADIAVYQETIDDPTALAVFRAKASELGGCGITLIFRKPVLMNKAVDGPDAYRFVGLERQHKIIGYAYYGKIVRRNKFLLGQTR